MRQPATLPPNTGEGIVVTVPLGAKAATAPPGGTLAGSAQPLRPRPARPPVGPHRHPAASASIPIPTPAASSMLSLTSSAVSAAAAIRTAPHDPAAGSPLPFPPAAERSDRVRTGYCAGAARVAVADRAGCKQSEEPWRGPNPPRRAAIFPHGDSPLRVVQALLLHHGGPVAAEPKMQCSFRGSTIAGSRTLRSSRSDHFVPIESSVLFEK